MKVVPTTPRSLRRVLLLLGALGLAPAAPALAQSPPSLAAAPVAASQEAQDTTPPDTVPAPPAVPDSVAGVPVVVRGDTLFRVYGRLGPFGPAERAAAIENRLRLLARTPAFVRDSAILLEQEGAVEIRAGESVLMSVTEAEARAMGLTPQEAGERYLATLTTALEEERIAINVQETLIGVALTLLVSALLAAVLWALGVFFPVLYRWLRLQGRRLPSLRIQTLELVSSERMAQALVWLARALRGVLTVVALVVYVPLVFSFFPATRAFSSRLLDLALTPLALVARDVVAYIPNLFFIAVIIVFTYYGLRVIRLVFAGLESGTISFPGFYQDWARPTYHIVRFLTVAFAVVMVWPYLPRSDSAAFRGVAAFLGLLVTFGSASAIANAVGGVVMIYMRPFQIGDRVKIADTVGDVIEKGLLVTRIRTTKHVEITVPNAMVLGSHIINYSAAASEGGVILHTTVTIGYDVPWRDVHAVMTGAARDVEGIMAEPAPFVLQTSLGDFSVAYELNAYTDQPNRMAALYSRLHENLQDGFNEAGIEILSPVYSAIRDGNTITIPEGQRPPGYRAGAFRLEGVEDHGGR